MGSGRPASIASWTDSRSAAFSGPSRRVREARPVVDELADRDRGVDSRLRALREIADLAHHQLDAPRARLFQPDDDPDERRLAAAVRSRDRDELAAFDLRGRRRARPAARGRTRRSPARVEALAASEGLPQRRQVLAHDGEVVRAALLLVRCEALDRIEHRRASLRPRARPCRPGGARRASRRTRSWPVCAALPR